MDKLITDKLSLNLDQNLRNDLIDNFKKIEQGVDGQADLLQKQIGSMLGDVPLQDQNEVTQARIDNKSKEFSTLKGRLDNNQQLSDSAYQQAIDVADELKDSRVALNGKSYSTLKARLDGESKDINNNINQQLAQMNTAPESVANVAELKTKYPNGKLGIFVAADNGHKYVWLNGGWTDTGVYQAVSIANQSITNDMLRDNTKTGFLVTGDALNLNIAQRTLDITSVFKVISGTRSYATNLTTYSFTMAKDITGFYLYYDTATQDINLLSEGIPSTAIFLGWISLTTSPTYYLMVSSVNSDMGNPEIKPVDRTPYISTGNKQININITDRTMTVDSPYFRVFYPSGLVDVEQTGTINLDNGTTASFIFYDVVSKKIVTTPTTNQALPFTYVYLGAVDWAYPYNARLLFPATIDGIDIFNQRQTGKRVELASKFPLKINKSNKTLNLDNSGWVTVQYDDMAKNIYQQNKGDIDISAGGASAAYIFVNINTLKISAYASRNQAPWGSLYLGWYEWNSDSYNFNFKVTFSDEDLLSANPMATRKMTFFGDSITWSYNKIKWSNLAAQSLGSTATINGVAGSTYSKADGRTDSAVERVADIKDQGLVVVWFGVNDFHYGRPLGEFNNGDVSTVYGAVDNVLDTLISNNVTAKIMVMTPMKNHGYKTSPDSFTKNSVGLYQIDYVNAIKQVADKYSLPVLDMYAESGIAAFNDTQASQYLMDGLHPNQAGEYRVAKRVVDFVRSHL
ncbi:SGNH/GDSL hydrolase family protein [uncultured Weissella sp.]|uniref:SGNH/GDSL hydrolase family protein n=1 Tax=uncultured Weissella sp. TaxID=253243 RepID=UPI00258F2AA6|nr:SGNH/GDSL hydrolase family protein [uncultured Weissella sp.]